MSTPTPLGADAEAMVRLAKALNFVCGSSHPVTLAVRLAASSGSTEDINKARALFIGLKPAHQRAALAMLSS
jgi:hypothetical protein